MYMECAESQTAGSEDDRQRGPEVALYAKGTEPLCTQQLPN